MKAVIVVVGMHRSGTSALARGLKELGVELGDALIPAQFDNPKGFYEDRDIVDFNDRLLAALGSRYDSLAPIPDAAFLLPAIDSFRTEAVTLLGQKMASVSVFGIKDPRTCLLLTFWIPVFQSLDLRVGYVIAVRNPLSVARSLEVRNQFLFEKSILLWLRHTILAVEGTHGKARLLVDYDGLMDSPGSELRRIASALGLVAPDSNTLAESPYITEFLTQELRHSRFDLSALQYNTVVGGLAKNVYEVLLPAAYDRVTLDAVQQEKSWQTIRRTFAQVDAFAGYLEIREAELQRVYIAHDQQTKILNRLVEQKRESDERVAQLSNELGTALVRVGITDKERLISTGAPDESMHPVAKLQWLVADCEAFITKASPHSAQRDGPTEHLRQTISEERDVVTEIRDVLREREGANDILARNAEMREAVIRDLRQTVTQRDAEIDRLREALTGRERNVEELRQAVNTAESEVSALRRSSSWRITEPLRSLRRSALYRLYGGIRGALGHTNRWLWHHLPLSSAAKQHIKARLFSKYSRMLSWTQAHRDWAKYQMSVQDGEGSPIPGSEGHDRS